MLAVSSQPKKKNATIEVPFSDVSVNTVSSGENIAVYTAATEEVRENSVLKVHVVIHVHCIT